MKICRRIKDAIPLFMTGDLDASEKKLVETHLANCPTCQQFSRETQNLLKGLRPITITTNQNYGAELVVKIQNRLQNKRRRQKLMHYLVPAFSSIAILIVVGFNILGNNSFSRQWLKHSAVVELYVDLTHSGCFTEMSEIAFDQMDIGENDQIIGEMRQKISAEIVAGESSVPVDDYVVATAYLTDQDFESFLKNVKDFTL